ncbi:zinc-finger protein, partial [Nowakowskiella sp. JEL0407]
RQRPDDFEEAASCQWAFCTKQFSSIDELLPHVSTSHLSGNRCSSKVRVTPTFTNTSESSSSRIVQSTENSNNSRINIKFNKSIPTEIITKIDSPNKSETLSSHSACTHPFDYDTYDIRNFNTLATAPPSAFVHACKWALCTLSNFTSVDDLFNHLCTDHLTFSISGPKKNAKNENQQTGEFTGIESQREQQGTESQEQNQRDELFSFSLRRTNSGEFRVEGERGNEGMTMGYDGQQEINEDLEIGQQQTNVKQTQPNQYIAGPHGCLWHGCQDRFDSFDKLTIHVSEFHIGTGKSQYVCEWKHCGREGRPFPQRQKVMRHIQTRELYY